MDKNTVIRDNITLNQYSTGTLALGMDFRVTGDIFTLEYEPANKYGYTIKYDYPFKDEDFPGALVISDINKLESIIYEKADCLPDWVINYAEDYNAEPIVKDIKLIDFFKEYIFGENNLYKRLKEEYEA